MAKPKPTQEGTCCYPRDQILATLYGQAIGDAIGLLTEFLDKEEAKYYYHKVEKNLELEHKSLCKDFHRSGWEEGDWTDDTDQMLLILQSIIDNDGQIRPTDFATKLKRWSTQGFPELGDTWGKGTGMTTTKVLHHPNFPEKAADVAFEVWDRNGRKIASNGGVMRTSIVGVHRYWDTEAVAKNAVEFCQTTHHDPRCRASAVAVSVAISLMLKRDARHVSKSGKFNVKRIIEDSYHEASKCLDTPEQKDMLREFMKVEKIKKLNLEEQGKIGYTYKCMGSGFWALKQKDFRKALQKIVMEGGDADTNGAVAGALLGCKLGLSVLPESWVLKLKHKAWLDEKIEKYLKILVRMKDGPPIKDTLETPNGGKPEETSQSANHEETSQSANQEETSQSANQEETSQSANQRETSQNANQEKTSQNANQEKTPQGAIQ